MSFLIFFIVLQFLLLLFMLLHDWISVPPFKDINSLKISDSYFYRLIGSVVNGVFVLIPLTITLIYFYQTPIPLFSTFIVVFFYLALTIGTIFSWWVPYIFGSSQNHKNQFSKFKSTHHFLPNRGDNVVPNTLHVILHFQVWACLAIAIYYLVISLH